MHTQDGVQPTVQPVAAPPGVQMSPEAQQVINSLMSQVQQLQSQQAQQLPQPQPPQAQEPGFWSRATEGLGEEMLRTAADTLVIITVAGVIYFVKAGVEAAFFKDEAAL
jgi:hypothetical protein